MAKAMVEVLVDDLDGSPAMEMVRLGSNGDWRELDLSKRNVAALSRALDRYWAAGRPVAAGGQANRRRKPASSRSKKAGRDPKTIRAWATADGIAVPARGRIPADVERQYNEANRTSELPARNASSSRTRMPIRTEATNTRPGQGASGRQRR